MRRLAETGALGQTSVAHVMQIHTIARHRDGLPSAVATGAKMIGASVTKIVALDFLAVGQTGVTTMTEGTTMGHIGRGMVMGVASILNDVTTSLTVGAEESTIEGGVWNVEDDEEAPQTAMDAGGGIAHTRVRHIIRTPHLVRALRAHDRLLGIGSTNLAGRARHAALGNRRHFRPRREAKRERRPRRRTAARPQANQAVQYHRARQNPVSGKRRRAIDPSGRSDARGTSTYAKGMIPQARGDLGGGCHTAPASFEPAAKHNHTVFLRHQKVALLYKIVLAGLALKHAFMCLVTECLWKKEEVRVLISLCLVHWEPVR